MIVRDQRLLPERLTLAEACALTRRAPRTLAWYVRTGKLREGEHYTRPNGRRVWLRDGLIAWLDGSVPRQASAPAARCAVDLNRSPELAAMVGR